MAIYGQARVGAMRIGGFRVGYYLPLVKITINGTDRRAYTRVEGLTIRDYLDGQPNIATMRVSGFTPTKGHEVKIGLGTLAALQLRFAGHIQQIAQVYEGRPANVAYDLTCISYEWLLNRRKVTTRYSSQSVTTIAQHIIANYTSGFTSVHVEAGLASLDEFTLTNEDVTDALDRLAKRIGGYWYIDTARDLHFFSTVEGSTGAIEDGSVRTMRDLAVTTDLTPVRTRVHVEGMGSAVLVQRVAGNTTLPVENAVWAASGGGTFVSGPQRITYTSKSEGGTGSTVAGKPLSPTAPTATTVAETSGHLTVGDRTYKTSYVTPAGESEVSSASSAAGIANISAPGALTAALNTGTNGNLVKGARTYKVTYVTSAGETTAGTVSGSVTIADVDAPNGGPSGAATTGGSMALGDYTYYVTYVTASGETNPFGAPFSVTVGGSNNAVSISGIPTSSDGRVTARRIYRATPTSQAFLVTTINDNSSTTYTDTTATASLGSAVAPWGTNTTGWGQGSLTDVPTSNDDRVTKRRIYRTVAGGSIYKLLTTINDNSTSTYADNTADESLGADEPESNTSGSGQIALTSIAVGPTGTTARKVYRTEADGSVYKHLTTISGNVTTTFTDNIADSSLGTEAPTSSTVGSTEADTTLRVAECADFSASGGWVQADSQILRFTGRSAASGEGNLTGIPASGVGSMAATVAFGSAVVNLPHLIGIPASGAGAILYTINAGDEINLLVTRDDATAQAAMAGFVGGDGIHEEYIQDRRLSQTEAEARGDAKLTELKDPIVTAQYTTRDPTTRTGYEVTINLGAPTSIAGTFKIQQVTYMDFDPLGVRFPTMTVTASSRRESFESLLRLLRRQAA